MWTKNFVFMSHRMIFSEALKVPGDEQNHLEGALKSWENLPSTLGSDLTSIPSPFLPLRHLWISQPVLSMRKFHSGNINCAEISLYYRTLHWRKKMRLCTEVFYIKNSYKQERDKMGGTSKDILVFLFIFKKGSFLSKKWGLVKYYSRCFDNSLIFWPV